MEKNSMTCSSEAAETSGAPVILPHNGKKTYVAPLLERLEMRNTALGSHFGNDGSKTS
jgi:hypothetical protein